MTDTNLQMLVKRPLSLIAAIVALILVIYELIEIARGGLYEPSLNRVDRTTLVGVGTLILFGLYTLRGRSDLQAVSFTLVAGLSFIFVYEAIYKWSFFLTPFKFSMPPHETREFVIQMGIAATVLTGFAAGLFALKKWTFIWLGVFVVLWIFWLLVGFPQLTGEVIFPPVIHIDFSHGMTYLINRGTKAAMCFVYLTLFPPLRRV